MHEYMYSHAVVEEDLIPFLDAVQYMSFKAVLEGPTRSIQRRNFRRRTDSFICLIFCNVASMNFMSFALVHGLPSLSSSMGRNIRVKRLVLYSTSMRRLQ